MTQVGFMWKRRDEAMPVRGKTRLIVDKTMVKIQIPVSKDTDRGITKYLMKLLLVEKLVTFQGLPAKRHL